jgi:hypothetical protein
VTAGVAAGVGDGAGVAVGCGVGAGSALAELEVVVPHDAIVSVKAKIKSAERAFRQKLKAPPQKNFWYGEKWRAHCTKQRVILNYGERLRLRD